MGGDGKSKAMKLSSCPECGEAVPLFAGVCSRCGAPNPARRSVLVVSATLAVLLAAAIIAVLVATRPSAPPEAGAPSPSPTVAAKDDFGWLSAAMQKCDEEAAKDAEALHFMVIPLVDQANDERGWRRISLNDIGNAILIKAEDMLAGLKRGALRISTTEYVFAARDEATKIVYKWSRSTGVKRFSSPTAQDVETFKVQFQSREGTEGPDWGATFVRRRGNCYWVNAIIFTPGP
jgi:hypothetical protein